MAVTRRIVLALAAGGLVQWPRSLEPQPQAAAAATAGTTYTVTTAGDYYTTVQRYLTTLANRADKSIPWTLQFAPGTYDLPNQWTVTGLQNVHITSQDPDNPATFNKGAKWAGEYIMRFYFGSNLRISHLNFKGNHVYAPSDNVKHWADQGIWFASTHDTRVDHCSFTDIGNAAIRHNTSLDDRVNGVNSWNHVIEDCTFSNCWQITTTQEGDTHHGGSRNWTFRRNTLTNARGSVKFATRTAGGHHGYILDNTWHSSSGTAIEIVSENNVDVQRNRFANIAGMLVNAYSNDAQPTGFPWGGSLRFTDNVSTGSGDGIRISMNAYPDGYRPIGSGLVIDNNAISNTRNPNAEPIRVVRGGINGITFTNNDFAGNAASRIYYFDSRCTGITIRGNTRNGAPYPRG